MCTAQACQPATKTLSPDEVAGDNADVQSSEPPQPEVQAALYSALLTQHEFGVAVCGSHGVLTMLSPAMEELLGAGFRPTPEHTWPSHFHLHDEGGKPLPAGRDPLARALRGERVHDQVVSVRRPGRSVRLIRCNALRLTTDRHEPPGAVVFAADITAQVAEQRRLDHLRDRLVTTVNHEVRTPLAIIRAHLELLEEDAESVPQAVASSLQTMRRATSRLGEVVRTISALADEAARLTTHARQRPFRG